MENSFILFDNRCRDEIDENDFIDRKGIYNIIVAKVEKSNN